ncbi:hypothetical protein SDRG_16727 [Saprolegnia diclina VS20]|uniref:Fe2OG dioxygenase domain-containing protein n=1 Tax=Saprolegnia diclina (strain VS20) TaxID=1156394 RepID=T0PWJ7_SAPDV|nr:hypothetical protein SDRG_16727 [Saprolegnia diclina VS20]EQC25400.1 hypothetical protein SDRG_16727 [Saprolegnia diclina VS20]|eukprot:XP_008621167.1 hypothetical protein SDRG_16727 [Saprolegnia diclina VS20]
MSTHPRPTLSLPAHAVQDGTIYYIPNWISVEEESSVLDQVHAAAPSAWVQLKYRRLQVWGGSVTTTYEPEPLPRWLQALSSGLVEAGVFAASETPNHALINDYAPGDGILPHEDGPMYYPLVAILSAGASGRMTFQRHRETTPNDVPVHLTLDRRSLLVFTGEAYTKYLHSIDNVDDEHGVNHRISLTIRHVRPPSTAC